MPSYETKMLERVEVAAVQHVSKELLAQVPGLYGTKLETSDELGFVTNTLAMKLRSFVLGDPDRSVRKTERVQFVQAHPTWKHHLTASLPEGSFLRRLCHFFWDIPFDYANTLVTRTVEFDGRVVFPEATVRYPDDLGNPHYVVQTHTGYSEEPQHGQR